MAQHGLAPALRALARRSPVPLRLAALPAQRFPAAVEATAYFVVCEAVQNVAKHAGGGGADVEVVRRADQVHVVVTDGGCGGARVTGGGGLAGLADRVAAVDGAFTVDSQPGGGTRVEAILPCAS